MFFSLELENDLLTHYSDVNLYLIQIVSKKYYLKNWIKKNR